MDEIARLKKKIEELENKIRMANNYAVDVEYTASRYLNQKSGVSRGEWAYAKGAYKIASTIRGILG